MWTAEGSSCECPEQEARGLDYSPRCWGATERAEPAWPQTSNRQAPTGVPPPWGGTRRLVSGAPGGPQHGNRLPGVTEPVGWPAAGEEGGAGRRVGARRGGGTAPAKGRDRNGQGVCSGWGGAVKLGWALDVQNSGDGPTRLAAGPWGSRDSRPTGLPDRRPGGGLGSQPLSCQLDQSGVRGGGGPAQGVSGLPGPHQAPVHCSRREAGSRP